MMGMKNPENSIPMLGMPGPFSYLGVGGMFTLLKVRDRLKSYDDPGWYEHPKGTVAEVALSTELIRDGIET